MIKPINFPLLKARIWQHLIGRGIADRDAQSEQSVLEKKRILVVDDDEMNRDVLERRVQRYGCYVESVKNGEQALKKVFYGQCDMVLLDINMPGMNGVEVLKQIRDRDEYTNLPIIMVSAQEDDKVLGDCIQAGASDYISKPFNTIVLRTRMQSCLNAVN